MLKAVVLVWTIGYILNGTPVIQRMTPSPPMTLDECEGLALDAHRMADWVRGGLGAPLDFPVAVYGDCEPVQQDAATRGE